MNKPHTDLTDPLIIREIREIRCRNSFTVIRKSHKIRVHLKNSALS